MPRPKKDTTPITKIGPFDSKHFHKIQRMLEEVEVAERIQVLANMLAVMKEQDKE